MDWRKSHFSRIGHDKITANCLCNVYLHSLSGECKIFVKSLPLLGCKQFVNIYRSSSKDQATPSHYRRRRSSLRVLFTFSQSFSLSGSKNNTWFTKKLNASTNKWQMFVRCCSNPQFLRFISQGQPAAQTLDLRGRTIRCSTRRFAGNQTSRWLKAS